MRAAGTPGPGTLWSFLRRRAARAWAVFALLPIGLSACEDSPAVPRALLELERMTFVAPRSVPFGGRRWMIGVDAPLLVDRFEATRGDWLEVTGAYPDATGFLSDATRTDEERASWPAFCSLLEARAFAKERGMRLLTLSEWVYVAAGFGAQRYPWGRSPNRSVANTLQLGLLRPLPVGCFERGRSGFGCYDMIGNVMEWVELDGRGPSSEVLPDHGIAMGDSYLTRMHELSDPAGHRTFPLETRQPDLGTRCAVEAEPWLVSHAEELERARQPERLRAVGAAWGPAAVPTLLGLVERFPELAALGSLLEGAEG